MPLMSAMTRREALGLVAVTATGGAFLAPGALAQSGSLIAASPLLMPDAGVCAIMPQATEGPFYFDPGLERQDITEGRQGVELRVRLQAVDASCRPLPAARVDIWHCDALGHYSGYPGQGDGDVDTTGEKFLRGVQRTDTNGIASFKTIYPGWYRGRTTHIHFKVFPDGDWSWRASFIFPMHSAKTFTPTQRLIGIASRSGIPSTTEIGSHSVRVAARKRRCMKFYLPTRRCW